MLQRIEMKKSLSILYSTLLLSSSLLSASLAKEPLESSLILYSSGGALLYEKRELSLKSDADTITYENVPSSIDIDSIDITPPKGITLYSQQYRFEKLTQRRLLEAYLQKTIETPLYRDTNSSEIVEATLLSTTSTTSLVETKEHKVITVKSADIIFPSVPKELLRAPYLEWNIKSDRDINSTLSLTYLINNITFKSHYILNIKNSSANLIGWLNVENRSEKQFKDTKLSILVGDINRPPYARALHRESKTLLNTSHTQASHKEYEGYHLYTIASKLNLAHNEKIALKFLQKDGIKIKREYSATLENPLYLEGEIRSDIEQYITIDSLDIALPQGLVRSYSKYKGHNILLGESPLAHTPKATPISLNIGKNFDLKVIQTLHERNDTKETNGAEVEYTIKNSSKESKSIELLIPFSRDRDAEIKSSQEYHFSKGNFVTFTLEVAAESSKSFRAYFQSKR